MKTLSDVAIPHKNKLAEGMQLLYNSYENQEDSSKVYMWKMFMFQKVIDIQSMLDTFDGFVLAEAVETMVDATKASFQATQTQINDIYNDL